MILNFAQEFSSYPYGRHEEDGKYNGEAFRKLLAEKFQQAQSKGERLEVVIDDVHGLNGSFLDEAFGEFAEQLKEESGQILSEKDLFVHGSLPHHKIYVRKLWECISKRYAPNDQQDAA